MFSQFQPSVNPDISRPAAFIGEPLITKPMDISGSAHGVKYLLRFSVQHPGANYIAVAIANLRSKALLFY